MKIFVDTGAWVALYDGNDRYHKKAMRIWNQLKSEVPLLFTSNLVIAETITLLRRSSGFAHSARFGDAIFGSVLVKRIYFPESLEGLAWRIFKKYHDQDFSFTDCTSFAIMSDGGIPKAFTFDHHFDVFGFERPAQAD